MSDNEASEPSVYELNVNINDKTADELRRMRTADVDYTELLRRAVEVLAFIEDEREAGKLLQVRNPRTGITRKLILL